MDYLEEARAMTESANGTRSKNGVLLAIAYALVAIAERLPPPPPDFVVTFDTQDEVKAFQDGWQKGQESLTGISVEEFQNIRKELRSREKENGSGLS